MTDYGTNSNKSKEDIPEKKEIKRVVTGGIKKKKKTELSKFADIFLSEDISNVKSYVLKDVILPEIKKTIYDSVTNGLDMLLNGSTSREPKRNTQVSKISYRDCYGNPIEKRTTGITQSVTYDSFIIYDRYEAEEVLNQMDEIIKKYHVASISDLNDLLGIDDKNWMDNKYGWTSIKSASLARTRDNGWILKLPRAVPLQ